MSKRFKSGIAFIAAMAIVFVAFASLVIYNSSKTKALADAGETVITLKIGKSEMTVNGEKQSIDNNGTVPVIINDRTLLPVRAVVEAMGGNVEWNSVTKTVSLVMDAADIKLVIDNTTAYLNDEPQELDTAPTIINDRTMLPIRFIAEGFGFDVAWDGASQTVTISGTIKQAAETKKTESGGSNILVAYFTAAENGEADAVSEATVTAYKNEKTGAAKVIADMIAEKTGADKFSIRTVNKFPTDYDKLADAAKEQQDKKELPELADHIEDLSKYDTVFVVYPAWWYDMPQVMYSFFDEYDFSGKTLIPAITHEGSSSAGFDSIAKVEPNAAEIKDGFSVRFGKAVYAGDDIDKWLEKLNVNHSQ